MNKEHHVVIKEENTLKHSRFRVVSDVIVVGKRVYSFVIIRGSYSISPSPASPTPLILHTLVQN